MNHEEIIDEKNSNFEFEDNADANVSEEINEVEDNEFENLKLQLKEADDKFLRLYAEFDNYKRRTMKERAELLQTAGKEVIVSFLPIVDDFERALKAASKSGDIESYKEGVALIHNKFLSTLTNKGLKAIVSIGEDFNVDIHEAITKIPAPSNELVGKVIDETEKGYSLNGHLVRFAKVIVGE